MELKLNIYDGNKIIKTYTAEGYRLKMGTIEEVLRLIDFEKFANVDLNKPETLTDNILIIEIIKIVTKAFDTFSSLTMDIFDGLTREEYASTDAVEVGTLLFHVCKYTFAQLGAVVSAKN